MEQREKGWNPLREAPGFRQVGRGSGGVGEEGEEEEVRALAHPVQRGAKVIAASKSWRRDSREGRGRQAGKPMRRRWRREWHPEGQSWANQHKAPPPTRGLRPCRTPPPALAGPARPPLSPGPGPRPSLLCSSISPASGPASARVPQEFL